MGADRRGQAPLALRRGHPRALRSRRHRPRLRGRPGRTRCRCWWTSKYFGGGEEPSRAVRGAVDLPLLYKEFVVDPWQVWHARAPAAPRPCCSSWPPWTPTSWSRRLHARGARRRARGAGGGARRAGGAAPPPWARADRRQQPQSRHLPVTTLDTTFRLRPPGIPATGCTLVSESGIRDAADVPRPARGGAHAVLVGEHLLRKPDLVAATRALMGA
jgi:indole-3-glycerol phosphate synthase